MNKYKIYAMNKKGILTIINEFSDIFFLDSFTSEYKNKQEFLQMLNKHFNKEFVEVYIGNQKNKLDTKLSLDILYKENILPKKEELSTLYTTYLLQDRERIRDSFIYHTPLVKNNDIYSIKEKELHSFINTSLNNYQNQRETYFQLLKAKIITPKKVDEDYLTSTLKNLNLDEYGNDGIIIQQLLNSPEENYYDKYDLDDLPNLHRGIHRWNTSINS